MRLLVVEDNRVIADALARGLGAEGFDVDVSFDGADGYWRATTFPYDLLVLDILLPSMNGYEICREFRSAGNTAPILMLTAKDGEYDIAEGLELGADDYLTKPFSFVVLVARLHALLRRTNPNPTDSTIVVGPLSIDTASRRCGVDGVEIDLTPREYSLLETMARRPGHPYTRAELLDRVWGADGEVNSNVVDVYVGYVRRKLSCQPTGSAIIETVRGIGYRVGRSA